MPTYEYLCERCGYTFDKFQHMNEEPVKTCPKCGGHTRRLFGRVGLIFRGSGFHQTDYIRTSSNETCCGRTERCETPPCSDDEICKR